MATSWVKTITSPFRIACIFPNQEQSSDDEVKKSGNVKRVMDLHEEVKACGYEDVQVMWSMLDKSSNQQAAHSHS